jgi:hypothetical protein
MNCHACAAKRLHEPSDWALHPYAGHGFQKGQGWSHPDLNPAKCRGDHASGGTEKDESLALMTGPSAIPTDCDYKAPVLVGAAASLRQNLGGDWVTAKAAPVGGKA